MAKGKRSSGKNYTSKGERPNVSRWIQKACRRHKWALPIRYRDRFYNQAGRHTKGNDFFHDEA